MPLTPTPKERDVIFKASKLDKLKTTRSAIARIDSRWITDKQKKAFEKLTGRTNTHGWMSYEALAETSRRGSPGQTTIDLIRNCGLSYRIYPDILRCRKNSDTAHTATASPVQSP
ncbi:MAG: hypothetical protein JRH18_07925 [Deltaproteobacteria bacterium]|nr:hypothetical protein [Deltaproteobacteria bacterium]